MTPNTLQLAQLTESLNFLSVSELKAIAYKLTLPEQGNKMALIGRILHFLRTGELREETKIPAISCAKRGKKYPLASDALMLNGAYKNDLKTRLFFKSLIGEHFHFTAFGIDWLNEQWLAGTPPTYQDFARMWQTEHEHRKTTPAAPKEEWAYIRFVQQYLQDHPTSSRTELSSAWELTRLRHKKKVQHILALILGNKAE